MFFSDEVYSTEADVTFQWSQSKVVNLTCIIAGTWEKNCL